jgi:hypothetical protein
MVELTLLFQKLEMEFINLTSQYKTKVFAIIFYFFQYTLPTLKIKNSLQTNAPSHCNYGQTEQQQPKPSR